MRAHVSCLTEGHSLGSKSRFTAHTSSSGPSNSSSSIRGRKHKAGETNTYPEKFACTGTQSEPSLQARRKAAEERAANLVRLIDAAASPPETITNADIVCPTTRRPLKCLAYALWYHTNGTNSIQPPCTGADRAKMVANDEAYQASRAFTKFFRPLTEFIYCVNCMPNGNWHVWKNSPNGGLTGAIRTHMLKYHAYIYIEKCKSEGVSVKQLDCEELANLGFNLEGPQPAFTREGLLERWSDGLQSMTRCFPHIINLATQAYLNALPESAEKFRQECVKQGIKLTEDQSEYIDAVKSNVVGACRDTVKAIRSSATRREAFKRNLIEGNQDGRFMLNGKPTKFAVRQPGLDCPARWGSTADMIDDVRLLYLPILDYSIRHTDLDIPCIAHKQFSALQNVSTVLSVPRRVQQLLSAEQTPTLSLALPLYNNLIDIWRTCITKFPEQQHAISAFAMFVNSHIKMNWIDSAWASSPAETTSLAEHALDAIKSRLLVYAEERDRKPIEQCTRIQSTHATRADQAAASQQNGYAELLLLGETIDRAPDHPLSSLVIGDANTLNSSTGNLGLDSPDSSAFLTLPAYLPDSDPHTVVSSSFDYESRKHSYAKLVSRLSPEQLHAKHMAQVEEEIAIWLGIGPLPLLTDPKNPLKKENMNMVEFWKRNGEVLPLIHRMAMDVLPAQASSVSSERVFSSSKLTCTRERNRISAELVEALQVLKHSVRQHRSPDLYPRLLDLTERIAPLGDDVVE
ncbi:Vacuolar protein sorting-associated protein 13a [Schizosaccharomyces pombe 972h-] [Rhizoctonia solani]|uniref:Vacuolar protein sorting-associated protein 13a [Schizosaccharomyces pombe 972h-] n=1 Tax=Rhizoctonia solani TaxID=456999 RepID=A0A0K6FN96_9AGAM|nr:Vacuolar protein sorting-associated protein 13a [Schizosaccharomyces pombe 972h-] [Rhizoctonia solani]